MPTAERQREIITGRIERCSARKSADFQLVADGLTSDSTLQSLRKGNHKRDAGSPVNEEG